MIVSNRRFDSLIEFALEVAAEIASTADEQAFLEQLRLKCREVMHPGYDMLFDEEFPAPGERIFWSEVYAELSRKILAREIANPDVSEDIRVSLASDADRVSRMLQS